MTKPTWLLRHISIGVKLVLLDQDGHVRALVERAGHDYYCDVWVNLHDTPVQTSRNRFPSAVVEEAESLLVNAGVEL